MPAPLRIILTEDEEHTLSELREASTVPYRTHDRAHMLRLNAQGLNVPAIADISSVINIPSGQPSGGGSGMDWVVCGKSPGGVQNPNGSPQI